MYNENYNCWQHFNSAAKIMGEMAQNMAKKSMDIFSRNMRMGMQAWQSNQCFTQNNSQANCHNHMQEWVKCCCSDTQEMADIWSRSMNELAHCCNTNSCSSGNGAKPGEKK